MRKVTFSSLRPLVVGSCLFALGLWCGHQGIVPLWVLLSALAAAALCALLCRKHRQLMLYSALSAMFFFGCAYMTALDCVPLPQDGMYQVSGFVTGKVDVREEDGFVRAYLKDVTCTDEQGKSYHLNKTYWVMTADKDEELSLVKTLDDGTYVTFWGKVYEPLGQMNPYGYDFKAYLAHQGVKMRVSGMTDLTAQCNVRLDFSGIMYRARTMIGRHMETVFGEFAYFPKALLLGDKDELPDETKELFSELGISHVLTVSGLHTGLLCALVMGLLSFLHLSPKGRMLLQGVFLFLYCALLNFSVPVVRASLLMLLFAWRQAVRRGGDPLTALGAVFLLILLVSPYSLFSLSFQMTFGAVLGIVLFRPYVDNWTENGPKVLRKIHLGTCLSATLGIMVPAFNAFHRFSLLGLLVSPVAVMLMALLLPFLIAATLLGIVCLPAAQWLGGLFGWLMAGAGNLMERMADLPFAAFNVPHIPWPVTIAFVYVLVLLAGYSSYTRRRKMLSGGAAVLAALVLALLTKGSDVCYIQLYAGQADAAVVLDEDMTVVIDTGTDGQDLKDLLLSLGRDVDVLVLSHLHSDHAGGVEDLLASHVRIGKVLIPRLGESQQIDEVGMNALHLIRESGIPIAETGAGDSLKLPSGSIDVLWPAAPRSGQDANDYCISMLLELENVRFLLMGDMPGLYEPYVAQTADVLKVSHHGSKDSTFVPFLERVKPAFAVITCAKGRNLPAQDTLLRLEASGARLLRTDETGAVIFTPKDGTYTIKTYLNQRNVYAAQ